MTRKEIQAAAINRKLISALMALQLYDGDPDDVLEEAIAVTKRAILLGLSDDQTKEVTHWLELIHAAVNGKVVQS